MALSPVAFPPVLPTGIAASAVGLTFPDPDVAHAVIFYRSSPAGVGRGSVQQCELTINGIIQSADVNPGLKFAWTVPPFDILQLEQMADLCEAVAGAPQRVPYGFKFTPTVFSTGTGTLIISGDSIGLTCATFLMAMFMSVKVLPYPIDYDRWGERPLDYDWQLDLWCKMQKRQSLWGIPQDELDRNLGHLPCLRYRPEEVVSSARFPAAERPATMDTLMPLGAQLAADLKAH